MTLRAAAGGEREGPEHERRDQQAQDVSLLLRQHRSEVVGGEAMKCEHEGLPFDTKLGVLVYVAMLGAVAGELFVALYLWGLGVL